MGIYQKILAGRIDYPRHFSAAAKDLISRMLTPDITCRLGNMKNGIEDIKHHKWFEVCIYHITKTPSLAIGHIPISVCVCVCVSSSRKLIGQSFTTAK